MQNTSKTLVELPQARMRLGGTLRIVLIITAVLLLTLSSGCETPKSVVYVPSPPPQVPPPTAGITKPIQRNYLERIEDFLSGKLPPPRSKENSSKPVEPTTKQ
jgi:hypothetical protein